MKNLLTLIGSAIAAGGIALMSAGCGEKGDAGAKDQEESKEEPKAASGGAGRSLEEQMAGYWGPNIAAMTEAAKKQLGDDEQGKAMLPMILAMMSQTAVEVKKGKIIIHGLGEADVSTYEITKEDAAARMLTMQFTDKKGSGEGTATIDGDQLILEKDEDELILDRITEEEFSKRQQAAAKGGRLPGLPEGIAPPIPAPASPPPSSRPDPAEP